MLVLVHALLQLLEEPRWQQTCAMPWCTQFSWPDYAGPRPRWPDHWATGGKKNESTVNVEKPERDRRGSER